MWNEPVKEVIRTVTKIFVDACIQVVPEYEEIREEFEIIDKVYIIDEMIMEVQYQIAYYLDDKYPKAGPDGRWHVNDVMSKWYKVSNGRISSHQSYKFNLDDSFTSTPKSI
jgi:hypothetical protein